MKKWESMLENELSFQGLQTFLLCLLAFCFFLKTYLVLLKVVSTQPHIIGVDGGFVRTHNALVIPGALLQEDQHRPLLPSK